MKKLIASTLCACMIAGLLAGCGTDSPVTSTDSSNIDAATPAKESDVVLNVWAFTEEVPDMVQKYIDTHPDYGFSFKSTIIPTTEGAYQQALDQAITGGGDAAPDIYIADSQFVLKYTQGDASQFAMPYEDLGIDVDAKLKAADIASYSVDIGTHT